MDDWKCGVGTYAARPDEVRKIIARARNGIKEVDGEKDWIGFLIECGRRLVEYTYNAALPIISLILGYSVIQSFLSFGSPALSTVLGTSGPFKALLIYDSTPSAGLAKIDGGCTYNWNPSNAWVTLINIEFLAI